VRLLGCMGNCGGTGSNAVTGGYRLTGSYGVKGTLLLQFLFRGCGRTVRSPTRRGTVVGRRRAEVCERFSQQIQAHRGGRTLRLLSLPNQRKCHFLSAEAEDWRRTAAGGCCFRFGGRVSFRCLGRGSRSLQPGKLFLVDMCRMRSCGNVG
jgi:hypothetical protein